MVGISDVAKQAGVSTASVSRVLAGKSVRDDVRRRVTVAVEALGYRPNRVARNLRSSRSTTIGLVVADVQNAYFTQVCRAVEDAASQGGYAVFLCNSDEDPAKEATYLRLLRDENVAGVILAPTAEGLAALGPAADRRMPVVVIDRPPTRSAAGAAGAAVDSVVVDNVAAAAELTAHLLGHGRRRVAGLFGATSATGRERHKGFVAAHAAAGVAVDDRLVRFVAPREAAGRAAAADLLAAADPPDALVTSNGVLAAGAFRALAESGRRCPRDVAFATFDETTWASLVRPAVTVVEQPTREIGRTAAELLLARIEDPDRAARQVILPYRLVVRESCGCEAKPAVGPESGGGVGPAAPASRPGRRHPPAAKRQK
jgi:LacI family fructose operon transcriptional repressor